MNNIFSIAQMPTSIIKIPLGSKGVHESCLRSYHIVQLAKWMLKLNVPAEVVLEIIEQVESQPEHLMNH